MRNSDYGIVLGRFSWEPWTNECGCGSGVSDVRNLGKYCAATNGDHERFPAVVGFCSRKRLSFAFLPSITKANRAL
jgi:hypothetical protein